MWNRNLNGSVCNQSINYTQFIGTGNSEVCKAVFPIQNIQYVNVNAYQLCWNIQDKYDKKYEFEEVIHLWENVVECCTSDWQVLN